MWNILINALVHLYLVFYVIYKNLKMHQLNKNHIIMLPPFVFEIVLLLIRDVLLFFDTCSGESVAAFVCC